MSQFVPPWAGGGLRSRLGRWALVATAVAALGAAGLADASAASAASTGSTGTSAQSTVTSKASTKAATGSSDSSKLRSNINESLPEQPNLAGHFVPTAPTRLLDTRSGLGLGGVAAPVGQNPVMLDVSQVTGDPSITPVAVVLNVTVVSPTDNSFLAVTSTGYGSAPTTSNLNYRAGQTVANLVTVPVGTDGKVSFYNAVGTTQVIADLAGYYTPDVAGSAYVADGPLRLLDTRHGTGTDGVIASVGPGKFVTLKVAGVQGVPSTGLAAVTLNLTATDATANGVVTAYPDGQSAPTASNLNYFSGRNVANLVTVQVGSDGSVDFKNTSSGTVDLIADLAGYYLTGSAPTGGVLQTDGPTRILDTRSGTGTGGVKAQIGANGHMSLQVEGVGDIPAAGVSAVILNLTVAGPTANGFVTAYPDGETAPNASNINYFAGQNIPNLVVVPVGADGKVEFANTSSGSTDLIADVFGYFSTGQDLSLSALSFATPTVDATASGAADTATWTIADSNPNATSINGEVVFRELGSKPDTYVGQPYIEEFTLGQSYSNAATFVSGDVASSTYSFEFAVPTYAAAASATWGITTVVVNDDQGGRLDLAGSALSSYSNTLTATETVSNTTPVTDNTGVTYVSNMASIPAVVYDGVNNAIEYRLSANDGQSGFWRGTLGLSGPGGKTVNTNFDILSDDYQAAGDCQNNGNRIWALQAGCTVFAEIPAGTAAGTWVVNTLTLTNNAGQSQTVTGLNESPVTVTSDHVVSASSFTASATSVNDWAGNAPFTVSMKVAGAQSGVRSIQLIWWGNGATCTQSTTTPTGGTNGVYAVAVQMSQANNGAATCTLDDIIITDGAGDVALYGTDFGAPALKMVISTTPDKTPPTVSSASLGISTIAQSQIGNYSYDIVVKVADATAPVNASSSYLYDSTGAVVGQAGGGQSVSSTGQALIILDVPSGLAVGTYTVGFSVTDEGRLTTSYGTPGGKPVPGGTLKFTVTAG